MALICLQHLLVGYGLWLTLVFVLSGTLIYSLDPGTLARGLEGMKKDRHIDTCTVKSGSGEILKQQQPRTSVERRKLQFLVFVHIGQSFINMLTWVPKEIFATPL